MANEAPRRREVVVNGTRAAVVDMHAHCAIGEAMALMGQTPQGWLELTDPSTRLAAMDAQGIDVEALSINPYWYAADPDTREGRHRPPEREAGRVLRRRSRSASSASPSSRCSTRTSRRSSSKTASRSTTCAAPSSAAASTARSWRTRSSIPSGPRPRSWAASSSSTPRARPSSQSRLKGNGVLDNVIGNPLETTIALSHLIFEGTLDRFPGVKILAAHGGGYLPSYAARSDAGGVTFPERFTPLKKNPTDYLARALLRHARLHAGGAAPPRSPRSAPARSSSARTTPIPGPSTAVEHILNTPGLTDDEKIAILGGTAKKLLGMN